MNELFYYQVYQYGFNNSLNKASVRRQVNLTSFVSLLKLYLYFLTEFRNR